MVLLVVTVTITIHIPIVIRIIPIHIVMLPTMVKPASVSVTFHMMIPLSHPQSYACISTHMHAMASDYLK
jgi:hypothetical protein